MTTFLIVIAVVVILGLASYTVSLLIKVKRQSQQRQQSLKTQHEAMAARAQRLRSDIHYIAEAMDAERCELSEGVLRIGKLFAMLGQTNIMSSRYPALFQHFELIEQHPIMEQRDSLEKQQRMKLDLTRMKSEAALEIKIFQEIKQLIKDYDKQSNLK